MSSRTQVAHYVADTIASGGNRAKAILEAAAWLKDHGRSRQATYLAEDVANILAVGGYLFARIATARPVTAETKSKIESYIIKTSGAKNLECEYLEDPKLIGGVIVQTPNGTLDTSVRAHLAKIVEGVSR